jgi:hypothetical protein
MHRFACAFRFWEMFQCEPQLLRFEAKRARSALIGDSTFRIDQVNAVRPACVRFLGRVLESINQRGKPYPQLAHTGSCHQRTLAEILRAGEYDPILYVALHLPHVAGMRFQNVDRKKCHLTAVLVVKLVEGRNLPPERGSSIASEDQNDWLPHSQRRQLNDLALIQLH